MSIPALLEFSKAQLTVIRQMCAKDCTDMEFSLYIEMAKARGLNPLLKHIYAMVLNKDSKDPKRPRQLVIIVSVDGQRVIANRTGNYRPDDRAPRFEVDSDLKDPAINPAGLISCEVAVHTYAHGNWFPVPAIASWEEFAPLVEEFHENPSTGKWEKTGRIVLDHRKPNWRRMPRVMLQKVAEMQALRKAFPDDFSGLYSEEELEKSHSLDLTASEILEEAAREHRQSLIGGPGTMIDWMDGGALDKVPIAQLHDRACQWLRSVDGSPGLVSAWEDRNRHALRDLWAYSKGDADDLKREMEKAKAELVDPAESHETASPLPRLRLRPIEGEEPEASSPFLRGGNKGVSELAPESPVSTRQLRPPPGMASGKGKPPRRDS